MVEPQNFEDVTHRLVELRDPDIATFSTHVFDQTHDHAQTRARDNRPAPTR